MASNKDEEAELKAFLNSRREHRYKTPIYRVIPTRKTKSKMQHDLARNLLIGFLGLLIVVIVAIYKYNSRFCSDVSSCGENFVNMKVAMDGVLDFASPFIGIIIGFFFSEKFGGRSRDDE